MKIKFIKGMQVRGLGRVSVGEIHDVDHHDAQALIWQGNALPVSEEEKPKEKPKAKRKKKEKKGKE